MSWAEIRRFLDSVQAGTKEDTMKDEKRYEWKDVTGEFEPRGDNVIIYEDGIAGLRLGGPNHRIVHFFFDGTRNYSTDDDTRVVNSGTVFRIERRVEVEPAPFVFKYTPEFVQNLRCKEMSDESVLVHDRSKWNERISAHEAGVEYGDMPNCGLTCGSCIKHDDGGCPLYLGANCGRSTPLCCDGLFARYALRPSATTARAVRDHIQTVLDSVREPNKAEPWQPQVGDRVRTPAGNVAYIICFNSANQAVVEFDTHSVQRYSTWDLTPIKDDSC